MNHTCRLIVVVVFFATTSLPIFAQGVPVYGYGILPCSHYASPSLPKDEWELKNALERETLHKLWWSGFVTGHNFSVDKEHQLDHWNPDEMETWMRAYCKENPKEMMGAAASRYLSEKVRQQPPRIEPAEPKPLSK